MPYSGPLEDFRVKSFGPEHEIAPGFKAYNPDPALTKFEQRAPDIPQIHGQGGHMPIIPSKRGAQAGPQVAVEVAKLLDSLQSKWTPPKSAMPPAAAAGLGTHRVNIPAAAGMVVAPAAAAVYNRIPQDQIFQDWIA